MKKGMILVAKDPCVMNLSGSKSLTVGKGYKVGGVNTNTREFNIIDDQDDVHWFDFDLIDKYFESDPFQEFFSFMHREHGLILTNGEMWDILHEIEKLQEKLKA
jgi:hypothetical protein